MPEPEMTTAQLPAPWFHSDADAFAFVSHRASPYATEMAIEDALGALGIGAPTASGQIVGTEMALRIGAAYACRRVIAEGVAQLPRRVVKLVDTGGTVRAATQSNHPIHRLLTDAPNDWMTPFEFVEYMVGVATFHQGAYALVQRTASGHADELLPLLPGSCSPEVDTHWQVTYRVSGYGNSELVTHDRVLRINGPMADPWRGQSVISLAREAVGLAAAIEASQARFHANDMRPSGALSTKTTVTKEKADAIRSSWNRAYGPNGNGGVAVLDGDWDFKTIAIEGAKSEVIENRKFQIGEICRFFGVFPTAIGHNDGSQSFASVEAFFTAHGKHTLGPWVKRVEEAMTLCLLTPEERASGLRIDLDMDAVMRGTPSERASYYEKATKVYMSVNEARSREGLDPYPEAEFNRPLIPRNNTGTAPPPDTTKKPASDTVL